MMNNGGGYERIRASLLRQSEGSEGGWWQGVHTTLMFSNREGRCVCVVACALRRVSCCQRRPWRRAVACAQCERSDWH